MSRMKSGGPRIAGATESEQSEVPREETLCAQMLVENKTVMPDAPSGPRVCDPSVV